MFSGRSEVSAPAQVLTETYNMIKLLFATDFLRDGTDYFETLAAGPLKKMLFEEFPTPEGRKQLLSHKVADKIVFRYCDKNSFKDPNDKANEKELKWQGGQLQVIMKTALVRLAQIDPDYGEEYSVQLIPDVAGLFAAHPWLSDELDEGADRQEVGLLLKFTNLLRIAMPIIPASSNKHLLLRILSKLEGAGQTYVTGGAMRPVSRRRLKIIEEEGHSPPVARRNRLPNKRSLTREGSESESPVNNGGKSDLSMKRQKRAVALQTSKNSTALHFNPYTMMNNTLSKTENDLGVLSIPNRYAEGQEQIQDEELGEDYEDHLDHLFSKQPLLFARGQQEKEQAPQAQTQNDKEPAVRVLMRQPSTEISVNFECVKTIPDPSALSVLSSDSKIWNLIHAVEAQEALVSASSSAYSVMSSGDDSFFGSTAGPGFGAAGAFALPLPGNSSRQLPLRKLQPLQQQYQQQPSSSFAGLAFSSSQVGEGNNSSSHGLRASSGPDCADPSMPPPSQAAGQPTLARSSSIKLAGIKLSRGNSLFSPSLDLHV